MVTFYPRCTRNVHSPKTSGQTPIQSGNITVFPAARHVAFPHGRHRTVGKTFSNSPATTWCMGTGKMGTPTTGSCPCGTLFKIDLLKQGKRKNFPQHGDNPTCEKILIQTINNYALTELIATPNVSREDRTTLSPLSQTKFSGSTKRNSPLERPHHQSSVNLPQMELSWKGKGNLSKQPYSLPGTNSISLDVCERIIQPLNRKLDVKDPTGSTASTGTCQRHPPPQRPKKVHI